MFDEPHEGRPSRCTDDGRRDRHRHRCRARCYPAYPVQPVGCHPVTARMSIRRFTRLTNAFSKKIENHAAAVALYFMYYNFGRVHQTLRVTPAMEAGVANHVWSIEEIVGLLNAR
jgi:hypothetical protein